MEYPLEDELPKLLAETGFFLLKGGAFDRAETVARGLLELRPQEPAAHLLGGMLAFARQRFPEAERCYRRILEVAPEHDLGRAFLAESLIAQKRWREAEELLGGVRSDGAPARFAAELAAGLRLGIFQQAAHA